MLQSRNSGWRYSVHANRNLRIIGCVIGLVLAAASASAADRVFPYSAFGPQALAYELIGMEWWQWEHHGDSDPRSHYPVKVVVYWDQSEAETKLRYPVIPKKKQDYRYVSLSAAVKYLQKSLRELKEDDIDVGQLPETLKTLKAIQTQAKQPARANTR